MLTLLLGGVLVLALAPAAAQASVTISDASVTEINGDGAVATFTVTRSAGLLTGNVDIGFATADGSAHAPGDYTAVSGTLFFGSLPLGGTQQQSISVPVTGDALDEPAETFAVVLSGSSEIADGEGVATITDDDPPPVVNVVDAAAAPEGATATFTIALSAPSGRTVSVGYATVDGSAVAGQDYAAEQRHGDDRGRRDEHDGRRRAARRRRGRGDGDLRAADRHAGQRHPRHRLRDGHDPRHRRAAAARAAGVQRRELGRGLHHRDAALSPNAIGPPRRGGRLGRRARPRSSASPARACKRPSTILVTVSCPRSATLCDGQVTIFSRPNARSKIKLLRKERRLGARLFKLKPGATRTLRIPLSKTNRVLLLRTGRMNVRAFAVTEDAAGNSGVRRVTGTLIFRTSHS